MKGTNAGASAENIGERGVLSVRDTRWIGVETRARAAARCLRLCRYSMWMWLKRLSVALCCGGELLSSGEQEGVEGEEGEKSAINFCASLDLGFFWLGVVILGGSAWASHNAEGTGPNLSA